MLVTALVHGANIQDRDGAPAVFASIRYAFPGLRHVFADGAYGGPKLKDALRRLGRWTLEIVKRSDAAQGFEVIPRRWVVERTLAWLNRNRRLAKDFEATIGSAEAWLFLTSVQLLTRRLAGLITSIHFEPRPSSWPSRGPKRVEWGCDSMVVEATLTGDTTWSLAKADYEPTGSATQDST